MAQNRSRARLTDVWTCGGCSSRWKGHQACHCAGCHQTLSGIGMFDKHRSHGVCKTPQDAGATRFVDGVWRGPEFVRDWGAA